MQPMPKFNQPTVDIARLEDRLTKAHVHLMSHPETNLYAGVIVMGKSEVVEGLPTACTDGVNKYYGADFCAAQDDGQLRFVVLHENLHCALRQLLRHLDFWEEDQEVANMAADYVVNGMIMDLKDKTLCTMPTVPALHDEMFRGWSYGEVYRYLRHEKKGTGNGGQGQPKSGKAGQDKFKSRGGALDQHDTERAKGLSEEARRKEAEKVARALEQGGLLAGRLGKTVPREIKEELVTKINWVEALREFVIVHMQGRDDDVTLRKLDRRWLSIDYIMPSSVSETVGELVYGIDASGSITDKQLSEASSELSALVNTVQPERVRVLWWDSTVRCEQVFEPGQYGAIATLLKPSGGGGTSASSVSAFLRERRIKPDCIVMLTDGYVENQVDWVGMAPTLWIVTGNKNFTPPAGRKIDYYND